MRLCLITYYSTKKVWGEAFYPLHKKLSFSLRIFSVHVTKSAGICGFAHIHWRNLSLKTSFFVQWQLGLYKRILDSSCHLTLLIYTKHKNNKMKSWTGPTSSCPCVKQRFPEMFEGIPQNDWNHSRKCLATSTRIQNFLHSPRSPHSFPRSCVPVVIHSLGYYERNDRKKTKTKKRNLPQRVVIGEKEIFDKETTAKQFNDYFINIGAILAHNFQSYKIIRTYYVRWTLWICNKKWDPLW